MVLTHFDDVDGDLSVTNNSDNSYDNLDLV